jgi:hypothetical protein
MPAPGAGLLVCAIAGNTAKSILMMRDQRAIRRTTIWPYSLSRLADFNKRSKCPLWVDSVEKVENEPTAKFRDAIVEI